MFPTQQQIDTYTSNQISMQKHQTKGTTSTASATNPLESSSPRSMQSRQRSRQQQKQERFVGSNSTIESSQPPRRTKASSPTKDAQRRQQLLTPWNSIRLDMRYDDDEFAYTAHLIMHHLEQQQQQRDARDDPLQHDAAGCVHWSDFHQIWNYYMMQIAGGGDESTASGADGPPSSSSVHHHRPTSRSTNTPLTHDLLAEFQFALKHRLKFISIASPKASQTTVHQNEEPPIVVLTRQVAKVIAKSGFPKLEPPLSFRESSGRRRNDRDAVHDDTNDREFAIVDDDSTTIDTFQSSTPIPVTVPTNAERHAAAAINRDYDTTSRIQRPEITVPNQGQNHHHSNNENDQHHPPPHHQPSTFDWQQPQQMDDAEYIRQQYQRELLQQQRLHDPIPWPYQEPVYYENPPPSSHHRETVVDAYFDEEEFIAEPILDSSYYDAYNDNNLLLDSNINNDIFVGIDRSFEEETVVMRQVTERPPAHFPIVTADGSYTHEAIIVTAEPEEEIQPSRHSSTIPPKKLSPERSIPRQRIIDEAKRVTNMMNVTSHAHVKASCRARLHDLQRELERLTYAEQDYVFGLDFQPATPQPVEDACVVMVDPISPKYRRFFPDAEEEKESSAEVSFFSVTPGLPPQTMMQDHQSSPMNIVKPKHDDPKQDTQRLVSRGSILRMWFIF